MKHFLGTGVPARCASVAGFLLALLALTYAVRGVHAFMFVIAEGDMHSRWQEVHTMMAGLDPNTLHGRVRMFLPAWERGEWPDESLPFLADFALEKRSHAIGVYPTYAYVLGLALHWPRDILAAKLWFLALQGVALCALVHYAAGAFVRGEWSRRLLPGGFALSSLTAAIGVGNYTLLVVAALAGFVAALRDERWPLAALCLTLAMIKPTIAIPFFALCLTQRGGLAAGVASALLLGALTFGFSLYTDSPILDSIVGATSHAELFIGAAGGVPALIGAEPATFDPRLQYLWSLGVLVTATLACVTVCRDDAGLQAAVLAVASVLWTYHRHYDHFVLFFLVGYLILRLDARAGARRACADACALAFAGLLAWMPGSIAERFDEAFHLREAGAVAVVAWLLAMHVGDRRRAGMTGPLGRSE